MVDESTMYKSIIINGSNTMALLYDIIAQKLRNEQNATKPEKGHA